MEVIFSLLPENIELMRDTAWNARKERMEQWAEAASRRHLAGASSTRSAPGDVQRQVPGSESYRAACRPATERARPKAQISPLAAYQSRVCVLFTSHTSSSSAWRKLEATLDGLLADYAKVDGAAPEHLEVRNALFALSGKRDYPQVFVPSSFTHSSVTYSSLTYVGGMAEVQELLDTGGFEAKFRPHTKLKPNPFAAETIPERPSVEERCSTHEELAQAPDADDTAVLKDRPPSAYRRSASSGRLSAGSTPGSPASSERPRLERLSSPSRLTSYHSSPTMDKLNARKSMIVPAGSASDLLEMAA